jgi:hypothetical protein
VGKSGDQRISVEVDPAVAEREAGGAETVLTKLHPMSQRAARGKWAAGEDTQVLHSFTGRLDHYRVTLSSDDLEMPS